MWEWKARTARESIALIRQSDRQVSITQCDTTQTATALRTTYSRNGAPETHIIHSIRPVTHDLETGSRKRCRNRPINSTPDSGASFSCRCTTSNVTDCLPGPMFRCFLEPVSGACVRGLTYRWSTTRLLLDVYQTSVERISVQCLSLVVIAEMYIRQFSQFDPKICC